MGVAVFVLLLLILISAWFLTNCMKKRKKKRFHLPKLRRGRDAIESSRSRPSASCSVTAKSRASKAKTPAAPDPKQKDMKKVDNVEHVTPKQEITPKKEYAEKTPMEKLAKIARGTVKRSTDYPTFDDILSDWDDKKKNIEPQKMDLNQKEQLIAKGAKRNKDDYPTMGDIMSDWDSKEERRAKKEGRREKDEEEEKNEEEKSADLHGLLEEKEKKKEGTLVDNKMTAQEPTETVGIEATQDNFAAKGKRGSNEAEKPKEIQEREADGIEKEIDDSLRKRNVEEDEYIKKAREAQLRRRAEEEQKERKRAEEEAADREKKVRNLDEENKKEKERATGVKQLDEEREQKEFTGREVPESELRDYGLVEKKYKRGSGEIADQEKNDAAPYSRSKNIDVARKQSGELVKPKKETWRSGTGQKIGGSGSPKKSSGSDHHDGGPKSNQKKHGNEKVRRKRRSKEKIKKSSESGERNLKKGKHKKDKKPNKRRSK
ncbi:hypothetical protein RB195_002952 [Necator americanus]|uniref:Uncharacterized protein n=1 Tax=Necator americanus TaxID=51031 RepID=A0ABR1DLE9_NECAM